MAYTKGNGVEFTLNDVENKAAEKWLAKHHRKCKLGEVGTIGGTVSYEFTMTGIGVAIEVKCSCGKSKNVTDYENW